MSLPLDSTVVWEFLRLHLMLSIIMVRQIKQDQITIFWKKKCPTVNLTFLAKKFLGQCFYFASHVFLFVTVNKDCISLLVHPCYGFV